MNAAAEKQNRCALSWKTFANGLSELLYPSGLTCELCGKEAPLDAQNLCAECRAGLEPCPPLRAPVPLDGLKCAFLFKGGAALGVHALKYLRQTRPAAFFAERMHAPEYWRFDAVVPVPLHPFKLWLRTYNQSELLAMEICRREGYAPDWKALRRVRFTRTQTALDETARKRNVLDAFAAPPAVRGRSFLLIDDVTTTHSTLCACALALKKAGAVRVYALCACAAEHSAEGKTN